MHALTNQLDEANKANTQCKSELAELGRAWLALSNAHTTTTTTTTTTRRRNGIHLAGANRLACAGVNNTINVWDVATGECIHTLIGHRYPVHALEVETSGGWLVSGSSDMTIYLWSLETGNLAHGLNGHQNSVYVIRLVSEGVLARYINTF